MTRSRLNHPFAWHYRPRRRRSVAGTLFALAVIAAGYLWGIDAIPAAMLAEADAAGAALKEIAK